MDNTWLKESFEGELLIVVSMDPNDQIFPIVWVVVHKKNYETWTWFLNLLGDDPNICNSWHARFVSDPQKVNIVFYVLPFNFISLHDP